VPGAVYPEKGSLNKTEGRLVKKPFGPVTGWHITYSSAEPTLVAVTDKASYVLTRPTQDYKRVFAALQEQAQLTWHVLQVAQ